CKTHGHAAHDCLCPTFLKQCNQLNTKMPKNLYKYFPTNNPNTWELLDPSKNDQLQLLDIKEDNRWTQILNKRQKQYTSKQPQRPPNNCNKTATSTNTVPLDQQKDKKQTFLDDVGMENKTQPGPSQQYCTPLQQQQAEEYHSSQPNPAQSQFSPLSTAA
ncbi:hypothetical protein PILCRDRAFT_79272, partial [Piloderma croceum F 1598]